MAKSLPLKTNVVELACISDSKITNVSLYNGLAEITRVCNPQLKDGDNKVIISGLPNVLLPESLRVEGHGPCTIHEVSISDMKVVPPTTTSPELEDLLSQKTRFEKALARCRKAIASIETFQGSLDVQHIQPLHLGEVQQGIAAVAESLDEKLLGLEEKLEEVTKAIVEERKVLGGTKVDDNLRKQVSITVFAEREREVEVVLIYGVNNATWDATYDIYVKTDTTEKPVTFIYKAAIQQRTGEAWNDIPLTVETVTPSFGVSIPKLRPWTLSVYQPEIFTYIGFKSSLGGGGGESKKLAGKMLNTYEAPFAGVPMSGHGAPPPIRNRGLVVSSKGDITATFSVPGLITIPSDDASHNVTITELELNAEMSWISVPKKSPKAHLTAKVKNESEYTFLSGTASVYVDGSFISRSDVPAVSPQESFDCPLGIDPTIRITYHPRSRKVNRTGFTRKTCSHTFEQRISVFNAKPNPVTSLKVLDQIPVSQNSIITVSLTAPPLVLPTLNKKDVFKVPEAVKISEAAGAKVKVQWDGADDLDADPSLLGKEGKLAWVCEVPAQRTVVLTLAWEVVYPHGTDVMGLDA